MQNIYQKFLDSVLCHETDEITVVCKKLWNHFGNLFIFQCFINTRCIYNVLIFLLEQMSARCSIQGHVFVHIHADCINFEPKPFLFSWYSQMKATTFSKLGTLNKGTLRCNGENVCKINLKGEKVKGL